MSARAPGITASMAVAASTVVPALAADSAAVTHVEATEVAPMVEASSMAEVVPTGAAASMVEAVAVPMAADTGEGFPCME